MLELLRKYQKYLFILITVMVVSSTVFFGAFSTYTNVERPEDKTIGKAIDGSDLKWLEIAALSRFLSSDKDDVAILGKHAPINLLNDGVIRKDLLATGIGELLIRSNFTLFKQPLEQKLQRVKAFRAYEHPEAPFISAKAVWQRFAPDINREWSALQETEMATEESALHLINLYQLQSVLPGEWLRRILLMTEQQYNWLHADQRLRQDDLSMFGFHTLSDWFGRDFVDLGAEFIHNAAIASAEKGYVVSLAEAKGDLRRNFQEAVQKLQAAKWPVELSYSDQLRLLGMDEAEAAAVWQKVLLFRRYFQDAGESAFLDSLPYKEFSAVAQETAKVDLYKWKEALKMNDSFDLYAFQTYLKAVAPVQKGDAAALPTSFYSVAEVEKKTPEFVGVEYKAKVFAVDKREASLKAPLKEVWEFETEEATWKRLRDEFPFLQAFSAGSSEERFLALGKISLDQRAKVDFFARRQLVDKHPEWIREALDAAQGKETKLVLSNGKIELPHIDDSAELGNCFANILTSPEESLGKLNFFETEEAVFRFENIEKMSDSKIKTFEEAKKDGSLAKVADAALNAEFPKVRMKLPADQAVKDLEEIKAQVAELLLADLKKSLPQKVGEESLAALRWKAVAVQARNDLEMEKNIDRWLPVDGENPLLAQFKLERTEQDIARTAEEDWMAKEPFILVPNQWSPVHIAKDGGVHFIFLKSRVSIDEPILEQLSFGKGMLVADVHRVLAEKLLETMQKKQAIVIPLQPEQE